MRPTEQKPDKPVVFIEYDSLLSFDTQLYSQQQEEEERARWDKVAELLGLEPQPATDLPGILMQGTSGYYSLSEILLRIGSRQLM